MAFAYMKFGMHVKSEEKMQTSSEIVIYFGQ